MFCCHSVIAIYIPLLHSVLTNVFLLFVNVRMLTGARVLRRRRIVTPPSIMFSSESTARCSLNSATDKHTAKHCTWHFYISFSAHLKYLRSVTYHVDLLLLFFQWHYWLIDRLTKQRRQESYCWCRLAERHCDLVGVRSASVLGPLVRSATRTRPHGR